MSDAGTGYPRYVLYLGLFGLAAFPRLLYLAVARPSFELFHWDVATHMLRYGAFRDAAGPLTEFDLLYPLFLAIGRLMFGDHPAAIQLLQIAVDSVGAPLLYRLTEILTGVRRAALVAAALYAFYPLLIRHAVVGDDAALLSVLLIGFSVAATYAASARGAAIAGLWLGAAVLTRAAVAPLAVLATGAVAITRGGRSALAMSLTIAAIVSPWLVRNYTVSGALAPTRGGFNLLHGNSRHTAALLPEYNIDLLSEPYAMSVAKQRPDLVGRAAEAELDRYYAALAWEEVTARPHDAARLVLAKAAYFFWPRLVPVRVRTPDSSIILSEDGAVRVSDSPPRPIHEEAAYTASYLTIVAAALVGIWMRRSILRRDLVLWCIVCSFVIMAMVFFPATRLRAPMEFVLLFYAAVTVDALLPRRGGRALPS
jgi:hypothetical protein